MLKIFLLGYTIRFRLDSEELVNEFKNGMKKFSLLIILIGMLLFVAGMTYRTNALLSPAEDDPLVQDAALYASDQDVSLNEAVQRMEIMDISGEMIAEITQSEPETFAGAWIQHKLDFRIVVQFTYDGETIIEPYLATEKYSVLRDLLELRIAKITLRELETTQRTIIQAARNLGIPIESSINVFENQVEFYTPDPRALQLALEAAGVSIPEYISFLGLDR